MKNTVSISTAAKNPEDKLKKPRKEGAPPRSLAEMLAMEQDEVSVRAITIGIEPNRNGTEE